MGEKEITGKFRYEQDSNPTHRRDLQIRWGSEIYKIMTITVEQIEQDITQYQDRIQKAREQLDGLPGGRLPYHQHKAMEKQRRECQAEIKHVKQLIEYAVEGIELRRKERCEHEL